MITPNKYKKHISGNSSFFEITSPLLIKNCVLIRFNTGSTQDPKGKEGLAHLIEHLLLHTTDKDNSDVNREMKGLYISGFTGRERTVYLASSYILTAEEIIVELLSALNFNIKKGVIAKEVEVISAEILREKGDPSNLEYDKSLIACAKINPNLNKYKHDVLGTEKSIKNITIQDIKKQIDTYYNNPLISIVSNKTLQKESIDNIFSHINKKGLKYIDQDAKSYETHIDLEVKYFDFTYKNKQVFGICLINSSKKHNHVYLSVLKGYLAGNYSSICNRKMRFEKQLTYSVKNYHEIFNDFSLLYIDYDVSIKNKEAAKKEYQKIIKNLRQGNIEVNIFEAAKKMLLSNTYDLLTDEIDISDDFLNFNQTLSLNENKFYTIENFIESVKKMTLEDFTEYVKNIY